MRQTIALFACLCALLTSATHAAADKRVALLIGNSHYAAVAALANPPNDVALLKAGLEAAGFDEVRAAFDLGQKPMLKALNAFAEIAADADIALIYYSGHGLEMNGVNYLAPVDARLASDADVADETVSLDRAMQALEGAKRLKLVILDACRNNPFLAAMKVRSGRRAIGRGLAAVEPTGPDTLVAYAAKAGTSAFDGDGRNSPFAAALANRLFAPGDDVEIALRKVRDDVLAATHNQQEPFKYGSLGGGIIPLAKATAKTTVTPQPNAAADPRQAAYDAAVGAKTIDALDAFLTQYPEGDLAATARRERERLADQAMTVAKPPPAPPRPRGDDCLSPSDDTALAPVRNLFAALREMDIDRYAAQWADDALYVNRRTGQSRDKSSVVAQKRRFFAIWSRVDVALEGMRVVSRGDRTAVIDDYYELNIERQGRRLPPERGHERYTVRCGADGRWLIVRNDDYLP